MQQRLKERLVGAAVLVIIAVIFIPMILTGPVDSGSISKTNIPERPDNKFNSKLVPLTDNLQPMQPEEIAKELEEKVAIEPLTDKAIEQSDLTDKEAVKQEKSINDKQVGLSAWVVQLGSFSSKVNADKLNLQLRKEGFPAFVEPIKQKNETAYRVRVGPELLRSDADALLKKIKTKMKLEGIVLRYP